MKIKTWFVRFEGNPDHDANGKFRVVSGSKLKPIDHSDEVVEFVKLNDIKPLIELLNRYFRLAPGQELPSHDFEILKLQYSRFKDLLFKIES